MIYTSKIDHHITHISKKLSKNSKANILIIHGMAESRFRYEAFMSYLQSNDHNVFAIDLRGHGESLIDNHYGYFGKGKGYMKNIEDIKGILDMIQNMHPNKTILFGHSMGSLFARGVLKKYPQAMDALILSGSPYPPMGTQALKLALKLPATLFPKSKSRIIYKLMNNNLNNKIPNPKTNLDWLSFDETNIKNYQNDPLCNFPLTLSGYVDLFDLMKMVYVDKWPVKDSDLPIHFVVGKEDPCVDFEHDGLKKAIKVLNDAGFHNITSKVYENSRHELLNDLEKEVVMNDLLEYIKGLDS